MIGEYQRSLSISSSSSNSSHGSQQNNSRRKATLAALNLKNILILIMIGLTFQANLSSLGEKLTKRKNENKNHNVNSNSTKHDDRGEKSNSALIMAIRKMYMGGHLKRDYAKYILLQSRDMMADIPSFYDVSLPAINDEFEERNLSKKRVTVSFNYFFHFAKVSLLELTNLHILVKVVGDIHANYNNMIHIFRSNGGLPSKENPYIFNGDLTDKNNQGIQCLLTVLLIKTRCYECLHLLRGNHELSDFYKKRMKSQVLSVYDKEIWRIVRDIFNLLPIGVFLDDRILVLHGGIDSANTTLDELRSIKRTTDEIPNSNMTKDQSLIEELLWAEEAEDNGITIGRGIEFGPDISKEFLNRNKLEYIIKGHTYVPKGFRIAHDGRVVTLHSAPSKLSTRDYGAYANIYSNDGSMHIEQFQLQSQSVSIDWRSFGP